MRIGLIAPPWTPVPPVGYGGTEVVVDNLARGLVALGHEVRLFTVGDSTCPVPSRYLYESAPHPIGTSVEEAAHVLAAYEAMGDVDLIHDHTVLGPLLAPQPARGVPPVVSTHHGAFSGRTGASSARARAAPRSSRSRTTRPRVHGRSRSRR